MNAPLSASSLRPDAPSETASASAPAPAAPRARAGRSWMLSLTGVCFVFGGLLAMQLRATQQVRENRVRDQQGAVAASKMSAEMKARADKAEQDRKASQTQLAAIKAKLAKTGTLNASQIAALGAQIKDLQTVAGLTTVIGPGVKIVLSDNPDMNTSDASLALPGLVHDYDLQQVVNELRAAKAEAIAIYGAGGDPVRVTGYTPIRCVGPTIMVNWEGVAAPFTIEAIGNPKTLMSALMMPAGIVDNLKNSGAIGVKVESVDRIEMPAATGGVPKLRVAKTEAGSE